MAEYERKGGGAAAASPGGDGLRGSGSRYFMPFMGNGDDVRDLFSGGNLYASPLAVQSAISIDRFGIYVTAAAASTTVRMGIYSDDGGKPNAVLHDFGTVDSTTTGVKELTVAATLQPGQYWMVACAQGGSTVTVRTITGHNPLVPFGSASDAATAAFYRGTLASSVTAASGALPAFGSSILQYLPGQLRFFMRLA